MAGGNSRVVRDKNGKFCKGRRGVASPQTLCFCKFIVTLIIVGAYQGVATRAKRQSSSSSYSLSSSSSPSSSSSSSSSPSLSVQTREWQHGLKRQSSPFAERVKVTFNQLYQEAVACAINECYQYITHSNFFSSTKLIWKCPFSPNYAGTLSALSVTSSRQVHSKLTIVVLCLRAVALFLYFLSIIYFTVYFRLFLGTSTYNRVN